MRPVHVLFGTESGNAQSLAQRTGDALEAVGLPAKVIDMMDFDREVLPRVTWLLVVTSTYGNGDPPSNAEALHGFLMNECPPLPGLAFSVCGLGDTTYDRFAQCGKDFDERLALLGAKRLASRQDCDVDYEAPFEAWLGRVIEALKDVAARAEEPASPQAELPAPRPSSARSEPIGSRRNPVPARVSANVNLNGEGSTKETRHVVLEFVADPLVFEPGDSIGVWAENDPALVDAVLAAARADGATPVRFQDEELTLADALTRRCEIQEPDVRLIERLQGQLPPAERQAQVRASHVVDLLEERPGKVSAGELVALLRPMTPRLYSVASSPLAYPTEVHLLVDVIRYELLGRARMGVASRQFALRAPVGAALRVFLQKTPTFRLASPDRDLVMIGPGTGVAPFRAFLQERSVTRGPGRSWLFFGSRRRATDFLYASELDRLRTAGVLTRLDAVFSRDQDEKVYVQHAMKEHARELWSWLAGGAVVYVCGDAKRMASDVHDALIDILVTEGGRTLEAARAELDRWVTEGRYQRDVY